MSGVQQETVPLNHAVCARSVLWGMEGPTEEARGG
jgi:hypothetical protein